MRKQYSILFLAAVASVLTFVLFLPALHNNFVNWDDDIYVYDNYHIRSMDAAFFKAVFFGYYEANWIPLTWMSHAIDYAIWGLNPLGHHLTSIVLHAVNTFMVILLIYRLLSAPQLIGRGGEQHGHGSESMHIGSPLLVAAVTGFLFGIHPLRVESVVWISERKDLLYSLFYLASIMSYISYINVRAAACGSWSLGQFAVLFREPAYLLSLGFFILSIMSKPMAVTLPAVLIILDWYPFRRISSWKGLILLIAEKTPFIAVSIFASTVTIWAQNSVAAISTLESLDLSTRLSVAFSALIKYLWKIVVPIHLVPIYPHPGKVSLFSLDYFPMAVFVILITLSCIILAKRQKLWAAVWGFFVISLLPVLGLIQVGPQAMADRYVYLPGVGPFLIIGLISSATWARVNLYVMGKTIARILAISVFILIVSVMLWRTAKQIRVWNNSIDFWNYVIEKEPNQHTIAYLDRGMAYRNIGRFDLAMKDINTGIVLGPDKSDAPMFYIDRGIVHKESGDFDKAIDDFTAAIRINPKYADAYTNRGITLNQMRRYDHALEDFNKAISLDDMQYPSYIGRGLSYRETGQLGRAIEDFTKAISIYPGNSDSYTHRGIAYRELGQFVRAIEDYDAAIRLNPANAEAYNNRGVAHKHMGQYDMAVADYSQAVLLNPSFSLAYMNRGTVLSMTGRAEEARRDFHKACDLGNEAGCAAFDRLDR